MLDTDDVFLAAVALAKIVRQEYGSDFSLEYIADVWGEGVTSEEVRALREIQKHLDREIREQKEKQS